MSSRMTINDDDGLPSWVTSPGFIFVACVVAFFGGPWVFEYAAAFFNPPPAIERTEQSPAAAPVACYPYSKNDAAVKYASKWRGNSDRVRAELLRMRTRVKSLMADCAYDTCEPAKLKVLSEEMGEYLIGRRTVTLVYWSQKGASGVDYVNSIFASEDDRAITRYLQAGFEKDELKRVPYDSNAAKAVIPVLLSKNNRIGICKTE